MLLKQQPNNAIHLPLHSSFLYLSGNGRDRCQNFVALHINLKLNANILRLPNNDNMHIEFRMERSVKAKSGTTLILYITIKDAPGKDLVVCPLFSLSVFPSYRFPSSNQIPCEAFYLLAAALCEWTATK